MSLPEIPKASVYTDFNGLAELRHQAREDARGTLETVAKQFESIFTQMMLKSMRDAQLAEGIFDSNETQTYMEMYDKQLATSLSSGSGGIGLAKMLVQQLGKNLPGAEPQQATAINHQLPARSTVVAYTPSSSVAAPEPVSSPRKASQREHIEPGSPQSFVKTLMPYAERAAAALGVSPQAILAQAALETGWGKAVIKHPDGSSSHNLFNIKADRSWSGAQVAKGTLEFSGGAMVRERAAFRAYDSFAASFNDYVEFLKANPRYREALQAGDDPHKFVDSIQQAGYATDPAYARKLKSIIDSAWLTEA